MFELYNQHTTFRGVLRPTRTAKKTHAVAGMSWHNHYLQRDRTVYYNICGAARWNGMHSGAIEASLDKAGHPDEVDCILCRRIIDKYYQSGPPDWEV